MSARKQSSKEPVIRESLIMEIPHISPLQGIFPPRNLYTLMESEAQRHVGPSGK
jgi:hypothetical protein